MHTPPSFCPGVHPQQRALPADLVPYELGTITNHFPAEETGTLGDDDASPRPQGQISKTAVIVVVQSLSHVQLFATPWTFQ